MDTIFLALRVLVSLGAVLGVIWFAHRWLTGGTKGRMKGRHVTVLAKQNIGPKASVAVIEADGKRFLLGVTEHAVTVLDSSEIPLEVADPIEVIDVKTTPIPIHSFSRALAVARSAEEHDLVREPVELLTATRRAAREAESTRPPRAPRSPLAGSILSPETWRQTATALRRVR